MLIRKSYKSFKINKNDFKKYKILIYFNKK